MIKAIILGFLLLVSAGELCLIKCTPDGYCLVFCGADGD